MKTLIAILLCSLCVASAAACSGTRNTTPSSAVSNVQIANPFVEYAILEEAAEAAGFSMAAPDSLEGFERATIAAIDGEMLQVIHTAGEDRILIRKAPGSEDISGDYNSYDKIAIFSAGEQIVTGKGNDGAIYVAIWTDGNYTFAIDISGNGLTTEEVTALVQAIA